MVDWRVFSHLTVYLASLSKLFANDFYSMEKPFCPHHVVRTEIADERHLLVYHLQLAVRSATAEIGNDSYLVKSSHRKLAHGVEGTQRVDGVVEKFNTIRHLVVVGEDVDDAATYGILSWFNHKVDPLKLILTQDVDHKVH